MTTLMTLTDAIELAARAHHGQVDKAGVPYILHPLRVMCEAEPRDRIVAVLHDVVEDTPVTLEQLEGRLVDNDLVALDAITRRWDEKYADYIARVLQNDRAMRVKYLDAQDNLRPGCPPSLRKRLLKTLDRISEGLMGYYP